MYNNGHTPKKIRNFNLKNVKFEKFLEHYQIFVSLFLNYFFLGEIIMLMEQLTAITTTKYYEIELC